MTAKDMKYVWCRCSLCGKALELRQWVIDEHEKRKQKIYCSPECQYVGDNGGVTSVSDYKEMTVAE